MSYVCVLHYNKKTNAIQLNESCRTVNSDFSRSLRIIYSAYNLFGFRDSRIARGLVEFGASGSDTITKWLCDIQFLYKSFGCVVRIVSYVKKKKNSLKIKLPILCGKTIWIYKSSIQLYFIKYDIGLNDINGRGGEHVYGQTSGYTHDGYASESRRNKCHKYVCKYYANNVCDWKISVLTYNHCPSWDLVNNSIEFIKFGISTFPIGLTRKYLKSINRNLSFSLTKHSWCSN